MIRFQIPEQQELFKSFVDLMDMARAASADYGNTIIGPFEDMLLVRLGIIIDGDKEKKLADRFEKKLADAGVKYERSDRPGVQYYEERTV